MNKLYPVFFITMISALTYSQSYFINTGFNTSNLKFTTPNSERVLRSDIGDSFAVGRSFAIDDTNGTNGNYEIGLTLNKFNPYIGAPESEVRYSLNYLGIDNAILYPIIGSSLDSRFKLQMRVGLSCNKLISGIQSFEGALYNIKNFPEFKGLLFMGALGLQTKVIVSDYINLNLGYNYGASLLNTVQKNNQSSSVSIHQIVIGVHFVLEKIN